MAKRCSHCGMDNPSIARECDFCHEPFDPATIPPEPPKPAAVGAPHASLRASATPKPARSKALVPILTVVAVGLVVGIVLIARGFKVPEAPKGPDDSSPLMGAKVFFRALKGSDWGAVHASLASSVAAAVPADTLAQAAAAAPTSGSEYAKPITSFEPIDQGEVNIGSVTVAFVAAECAPTGPQTVFLVNEAGHWKVLWCPMLEEPPFLIPPPV